MGRGESIDIRRVVSVPTDTPFFPVDLVDRFLAEPPRIPTLFVARSQSGVHPVVGMWTVEIAPELAKALAEGKRKVGDWTRQQKAVEVVFPAADHRWERGRSPFQHQSAGGSCRGGSFAEDAMIRVVRPRGSRSSLSPAADE